MVCIFTYLHYFCKGISLQNVASLFAAATASDYASAQMVSEDTVSKFKEYEKTTPGLNYGMVQSAATSSEFVSRCVVNQKKKSSKLL